MPPDLADPATLDDLDSSDPLAVAFAVRRGADRLRSAAWDPGDLQAFVAKLRVLAKDPNARVRQSVAEAAPHLPEAVFQEILPPLIEDRSPFVRDAASRSQRKRSALRRAAAQEEEHDARVAGWYREIDALGAQARTLARRISSHETEYFVRRMVHEAGGAFMAFDEAARKLREGLDAPDADRARLGAELDRIEERFAFFKHVLATGRANAKAEEPEFREESVAAIVLDEVALLGSRFPERAGRFAFDTSGVDRALVADIDAAFLREALANLLKNAVEAYDAASDAPVRIRVSLRALPGGTDAEIAIADDGCGMDASSVERAFVPFGSTKKGGTGFGLFLARRVARAIHGGDLSLVSARGGGTTVTMTLPLRQHVPKRRGGARRTRGAGGARATRAKREGER
jgi:signal transduction histidine kinase